MQTMHAGLGLLGFGADFRISSQSTQPRAPVKRWEGKFMRTMTDPVEPELISLSAYEPRSSLKAS